MKIEIVTTAKAVEKTNYLLAQAIKSAENSKAVRDGLGLSEKDLADNVAGALIGIGESIRKDVKEQKEDDNETDKV